jgi:hypothetical protein
VARSRRAPALLAALARMPDRTDASFGEAADALATHIENTFGVG